MKKLHLIPAKTRRKINRSGVEICPICKNQAILVKHHINGKNIEDSEEWWNKANICDCCHRLTHTKKGIIIEGWFSTTSGMELIWHYNGKESISGQSATPYLIPNSIKNQTR